MNLSGKLFVTFVMLVLVSSCGRRPGRIGAAGADGKDGKDEKDGYSLVVDVQVMTTEDGITCNRTDIFQDFDRNNVFSPELS